MLEVQPDAPKKYRNGIHRKGTQKADQIEWTGELEMYAVYSILEGRGWHSIIQAVATSPEKEAAIQAKVDKIIAHHRYEDPKFTRMVSRKGNRFTKVEDRKLIRALKSRWINKRYDNPYDYIKKVFGRPESELRARAEHLLDRKGFF